MAAYYNEIDPYAAQWLRNLIAARHIAPGDVDERSIADLQGADLRGYTQCHFFAGIGGWSYALRIAGWPDDRPVWTGSCPCQPFSTAGKQRGQEDDRHLWPAFFRLIRECRPGVLFGEQVAGAAGYAWWDHVAADLESEGYAAAAADLGAHSVGAPHIRQRLYWVAHSNEEQCGKRRPASKQEIWPYPELARSGAFGALADANRYERRSTQGPQDGQTDRGDDATGRGAMRGHMGNANGARLERRRDESQERTGEFASWAPSPWRDFEWLTCSDGKARPTQPGLFPLAHGVPNRVGRLRAYGNAIVPQVAAKFILANIRFP